MQANGELSNFYVDVVVRCACDATMGVQYINTMKMNEKGSVKLYERKVVRNDIMVRPPARWMNKEDK